MLIKHHKFKNSLRILQTEKCRSKNMQSENTYTEKQLTHTNVKAYSKNIIDDNLGIATITITTKSTPKTKCLLRNSYLLNKRQSMFKTIMSALLAPLRINYLDSEKFVSAPFNLLLSHLAEFSSQLFSSC